MNIKSPSKVLPCIILLACFTALPTSLFAQKEGVVTKPMVDHALQCVGLDQAGVIVDQTELKPEDHFLPFATKRDTILRIHVKNFKLTVKAGNRIVTNPSIVSLNIYYSENAGQVVETVSDWPPKEKAVPFLSVAAQEKNLKSHAESFAGVPISAPHIKLMDALQSAASISIAKQVVVYYTLMSFQRSAKTVPAWVIYTRGLPGMALR